MVMPSNRYFQKHFHQPENRNYFEMILRFSSCLFMILQD